MKKLLFLLLTVILTGCAGNGGSGDNADSPAEPNIPVTAEAATPEPDVAPSAPATNADGFVFVYNGANIYMDENMADVLAKIGEPRHEFEAPSCAFDGIDRIFSYPGVEIHTYPKNEEDFVHTVNYKDDSVGTPEGIYLGSSLADVINAYGEDYEQELGLYKFTRSQTYLSFLVDDNDMVIVITYGLLM